MENNNTITGEEKRNIEADKQFNDKKTEALKDDDKMYDLYRNYVGTAETWEERKRRINIFRCGGRTL